MLGLDRRGMYEFVPRNAAQGRFGEAELGKGLACCLHKHSLSTGS